LQTAGIDGNMEALKSAKNAAEATRNEVQLRYNAAVPKVGTESLRGARQATEALETIFRNALAAAATGKLTDTEAVSKQFEASVRDIKAGLPQESGVAESLPALEAAAAALSVGSKRGLGGEVRDESMGGEANAAVPSGNE